ncbi:helix-turn-helix domain-containing protein [Promicromonospora sp. NPDC060271]|uniref:helix-turn-helix domain-containing protein n=1 Tax=Promicromonospora sp. NPDC060271 TaxID=3347089 RepID=UPI00365B759C
MPGPDHLQNLGRRLRALRVGAGLAGKELAEALGWPASKVSRLELARQNASPSDINAWVTATGASTDERTLLLGLLDQAREDLRTYRQRTRHGQAAVQAGYNTLVERSSLLREFHTTVVPGMLQTPDYARAILAAASRAHEVPVPDVEVAVATRMERQRYLYTPRRFEFVLAEPVLRWGLVPNDVMRVQIDRLQSVIGLPNVRLGVLPFGATDDVPTHMFEMFDDLVCVETVSREHRYTGPEAEVYTKTFADLQKVSLTGEDARRFLLRITNELP